MTQAVKKKILLISGIDPSGEAGLLADLEIIFSLNLAAATCVTALTSQNKNQFYKSHCVSPKIFKSNLQALKPLSQFAAIKIGMLGNEKIITILAKELKEFKGPIILDPVTRSSSGGTLLTLKGQKALVTQILPLVTLWTPNLAEAQLYLKQDLSQHSASEIANLLFKKYKIAVYFKGGHLKGNPVDVFDNGQHLIELKQTRLNKKLRGTGCRLATLLTGHAALKKPFTKARLIKWRHQFQFILKNMP